MAQVTSVINVNVPSDVKKEATKLFNNLGLSMSSAINIFLKKSIKERGIPFDVKETTPKEELALALKELEYMEEHPDEYKSYKSISKLKEDLLSDD